MICHLHVNFFVFHSSDAKATYVSLDFNLACHESFLRVLLSTCQIRKDVVRHYVGVLSAWNLRESVGREQEGTVDRDVGFEPLNFAFDHFTILPPRWFRFLRSVDGRRKG